MNTTYSVSHSVSYSRAGYGLSAAPVRAYVSTLSDLSAAIRHEGAVTVDALASLPALSHLSRPAVASMVDSLVRAGCVEREGQSWLLWVNPTVEAESVDVSTLA